MIHPRHILAKEVTIKGPSHDHQQWFPNFTFLPLIWRLQLQMEGFQAIPAIPGCRQSCLMGICRRGGSSWYAFSMASWHPAAKSGALQNGFSPNNIESETHLEELNSSCWVAGFRGGRKWPIPMSFDSMLLEDTLAIAPDCQLTEAGGEP